MATRQRTTTLRVWMVSTRDRSVFRMATTETKQRTVAPETCVVGSLLMDIDRNKVGEVMGHHGGDRVQLRPLGGGREWDAFKLRPVTPNERRRAEADARSGQARRGS